MPIEIGLWKMGAQLEPVRFQPLENEKKLEAALATDLSLVGEGLLLIKRQVATASGKFVDMLAVDVQGTLGSNGVASKFFDIWRGISVKGQKSPRHLGKTGSHLLNSESIRDGVIWLVNQGPLP